LSLTTLSGVKKKALKVAKITMRPARPMMASVIGLAGFLLATFVVLTGFLAFLFLAVTILLYYHKIAFMVIYKHE